MGSASFWRDERGVVYFDASMGRGRGGGWVGLNCLLFIDWWLIGWGMVGQEAPVPVLCESAGCQ